MTHRLRRQLVALALGPALSVGCRPTTDRAPAGADAGKGAVATERPSIPPDTLQLPADSTVGRDSLVMRMSAGPVDSALPSPDAPPLHVSADSQAVADSGIIRVYPAEPRRGGVIVAIASFGGDSESGSASCTWRAEPVPCRATQGAIRAFIPLSPELPAGSYTLTIRGPSGAGRRTVQVAEREFGQELVFLDSARYTVFTHPGTISRDARIVRQALATESTGQLWAGRWLPPPAMRGTSYGVERAYYPASDSSRVIRSGPMTHAAGAFGADTAMLKSGAIPSWRHTGIDVSLARGTPVRATAAGIVADVGEYILTGRTVVLDHGEGVHSAYFHLDTVTVHRGDRVRRGERVGRVGQSGLATGPHLHYGVYVHGEDVDPVLWHALPVSALTVGSTR